MKQKDDKEWMPFGTFNSINNAYHADHSMVGVGTCLPIGKERYRIYVGKKNNGSYYICKLMKEWGKEIGCFESNSQAVSLINKYSKKEWINASTSHYIYKYVKFNTLKDAMVFKHQIIAEVELMYFK